MSNPIGEYEGAKVYDDLVPIDQMKKRLARDKFDPSKLQVILDPTVSVSGRVYYRRRWGIPRPEISEGLWRIYFPRRDGRVELSFGHYGIVATGDLANPEYKGEVAP